jgi:iron complex outermembrane recepter protein
MARRSQDQRLRFGNGSRSALAVAVAAVLAGAPVLAFAQAAPAAPAPEGGGLQEIVVTATRHEENLSKVPISVTALTQEAMDSKGIKDILDIARFTPGVNVDNSGTNNIAIRGIASSGGAGTTGIYIDDTPIQMRALAFNPDEALPKSFDMERVEILRGPQGTLFGAGSEGGTVRYITTPPSLTKSSIYSRDEISYTEGGSANYEAGIAAGGPLVDGVLGARATVWYRRDGGWVDLVDPTAANPQNALLEKNANWGETLMLRLAGLWAINDRWTMTPSILYQNRQKKNVDSYWPLYSDANANHYVSADPTGRPTPDKFYLPALKFEGDFGATRFISNTSYYHRQDTTGYDGTLYNLGFYQSFNSNLDPNGFVPFVPGNQWPLVDGNGIHLPASIANYRSPATVDNGQSNFTQEFRLQSNDPNAPLVWTTGLFYSYNTQTYLEQIHDPMLESFWQNVAGTSYLNVFTDPSGNSVPYDSRFPTDSYFLQTNAHDLQIALFGEMTYALTEKWKLTAGLRASKLQFSFDTLTGGPQLFLAPQSNIGVKKENSTTPKLGLAYQADPFDLYYFTYAKGFRPGGANNPVPQAACATDFQNFGIASSPATYNSDTVDSFEVGAKNNFSNRVKIASSVYYIKWKNIQQTVIPPICQISFIDNLGAAVAKGADIQVEFALGGAFSGELSAGYTDARYSQFSTFGGSSATPIAASGDAIEGQSAQPAPPVTASIGLEYRFSFFEQESFVRIDYEYQGAPKWAAPGQDGTTVYQPPTPPGGPTPAPTLGTAQFDAANYFLSSTSFASLRAGTTIGAWSVAAFVDNLTDSHTGTNYNWTIDPGTGDSRLQRLFTFRPRTFGLTFTYRN